MSTGENKIAGSLDFEESNPLVAPNGITRWYRKGGVMYVSVDGGNGVPVPSYPENISTLTAPDTSISLSGLLPAVQGNYDLYAMLLVSAANSTFKMQINDLDTNLRNVSGNFFTGAVRHTNSWALGRNTLDPLTFASGDVVIITGRCYARTGRVRFFDLCWYLRAAANDDAGYWKNYYDDTSTAISKVSIVATAGQINTGSAFILTPVPSST